MDAAQLRSFVSSPRPRTTCSWWATTTRRSMPGAWPRSSRQVCNSPVRVRTIPRRSEERIPRPSRAYPRPSSRSRQGLHLSRFRHLANLLRPPMTEAASARPQARPGYPTRPESSTARRRPDTNLHRTRSESSSGPTTHLRSVSKADPLTRHGCARKCGSLPPPLVLLGYPRQPVASRATARSIAKDVRRGIRAVSVPTRKRAVSADRLSDARLIGRLIEQVALFLLASAANFVVSRLLDCRVPSEPPISSRTDPTVAGSY